ncbi:PfkB family carbohydrate kinase [Haemophilus haemolyticus]|uniref:PfkB family carbohydrate kinase n=1 Tax=Haemophilus haemolyticus TaxID=726 RepID=UPI001CC828CD|nr:PfkB family carbohydrate kinase [Haemophilus haemolyticus]
MTPFSASELLNSELRQKYLNLLWQQVSMTQDMFNELYKKPIERYAEMVQLLPASESHHHSHLDGMLDHGLEVLSFSAKLRQSYVLPLADVITPNIPEAEALTGIKISDTASVQQAALDLQKQGAKNVIIKGGHSLNSQSQQCQDWVLLQNGEHFVLESPRFDTPHTHGTGCTFSACLTAELAKGAPLKSAVKTAKDFITAAISHPLNIGHGHGPTNHWAYSHL